MEILIGFYNVENLFDTEDNPYTSDEDFLPEGKYKWTDEKYEHKLGQIANAIGELGKENGRPVDVLGLAEVENLNVIEDLISTAPLSDIPYKIAHEESVDRRGIDLAVIYNEEFVNYFDHHSTRINFPEEPFYKSRDILTMEASVNGHDIYFFVNHWPSRREGRVVTEARRKAAAEELDFLLDSISNFSGKGNFVIMGDFNDDPDNISLSAVLNTEMKISNLEDGELFNPFKKLLNKEKRGSLWHDGKFNLFDQILVSEDLISGDQGIKYIPRSANIFDPEFLQVSYGKAKGAPRKALFNKEFVPEGYSDHFPVYLKLKVD